MTPDELTAFTLEARRDALLAALDEPIEKERALAICDELADLGAAIDGMYLPDGETYVDWKLCRRFGCSL